MNPRPPGALGDTTVRVLLAVLAGARLMPELVLAVGRSRQVIHVALVELRDAGLVDWQDRHAGTLHPTVERLDLDVNPTVSP